METSEELEWELYDIFISGIFAFPIYEHNAARRVVRYLLMRGVLDEEIASAIEGPTVDLRIWLNRGGKHLVGEWVIAWLNDSRDLYKNRRRTTAGSRGRTRLRDRRRRRRILYGDGGGGEDEEEARDGSPFSVQTYLGSSSATHRSSFSSDSNDSRWTKEEDESDISSDYELEEEQDDDEVVDGVEEEGNGHSLVQRRSMMEEVDVKDEGRRPRDSQTLEIVVESSHTDCEPHYKLHRPQTLSFDPDTMSLMQCLPMTTTGGSSAIDDPDSGHVSDTPCSCLLLHCLHSFVHNDDDTYEQPSAHAHRAENDASLPVYCSACRSRLPLYEKIHIVSDAHQMACAGCRNDEPVAMDTDDCASKDVQRRHEVTTA